MMLYSYSSRNAEQIDSENFMNKNLFLNIINDLKRLILSLEEVSNLLKENTPDNFEEVIHK